MNSLLLSKYQLISESELSPRIDPIFNESVEKLIRLPLVGHGQRTQNLSVCLQNIKPSVHKEEGFTSPASNSSPIPASAETLWLIDWLPVRPPVLSGRGASGKSIRQKGSQREALSPPAGTPASETALVLVNDSDQTGFKSTLQSWNLPSFMFSSCVVAEPSWLTDTGNQNTHRYTHNSVRTHSS